MQTQPSVLPVRGKADWRIRSSITGSQCRQGTAILLLGGLLLAGGCARRAKSEPRCRILEARPVVAEVGLQLRGSSAGGLQSKPADLRRLRERLQSEPANEKKILLHERVVLFRDDPDGAFLLVKVAVPVSAVHATLKRSGRADELDCTKVVLRDGTEELLPVFLIPGYAEESTDAAGVQQVIVKYRIHSEDLTITEKPGSVEAVTFQWKRSLRDTERGGKIVGRIADDQYFFTDTVAQQIELVCLFPRPRQGPAMSLKIAETPEVALDSRLLWKPPAVVAAPSSNPASNPPSATANPAAAPPPSPASVPPTVAATKTAAPPEPVKPPAAAQGTDNAAKNKNGSLDRLANQPPSKPHEDPPADAGRRAAVAKDAEPPAEPSATKSALKGTKAKPASGPKRSPEEVAERKASAKLQLAKRYKESEPERAIEFANQAIELAPTSKTADEARRLIRELSRQNP